MQTSVQYVEINTRMEALQIAVKNGYVAIAHGLIQAGAKPAIALEEAWFHGGLDISVLLEIAQVSQCYIAKLG